MTLFHDYTFQVVALGTTLLGVLSGVVGSFAILRGQGLLGDGISHCTLPGLVFAFLVTGTKSTEVLLLGGFLSALLSIGCIHLIAKYTKLKFDSSLALVLSVFFGLGLVLLTQAQKLANANQAGLDRFLYGQASSLMAQDVLVVLWLGGFLLLLLALLWPTCFLVVFDPLFARSLDLPVQAVQLFLSGIMIVTILLGLQSVGVILMSALLVAPAVSARQWVNHLVHMVLLAGFFGGLSGLIGTWISTYFQLATGPVIVVCATSIAFCSLLFPPNRGLLHRLHVRKKERRALYESCR